MPLQDVFGGFTPIKPYDPTIQEGRDLVNAQRKATLAAADFTLQQKKQNEKEANEVQAILAGAPDFDTAYSMLTAKGYGERADKWAEQHYKAKSEQAKALQEDNKLDQQQTAQGLQIVQAMRQSPSSYAIGKQMLARIIPDEKAKQTILGILPDQYDPATTPQILEQVYNSGLSTQDYNKKEEQNIKNLYGDKPREGLFGTLALATSQAEWDTKLKAATDAGLPAGLIAEAGPTFSPEQAQKLGQAALTPAERATDARAKATDARLTSQDATSTALRQAELGIQQGNLNMRRQELAQRQAGGGSAGGAAGGGGLDPDAVEETATRYRLLGTAGIPTRIGEADRVRILNAAAAQSKMLGQSPAQAVQKMAALKSDGSSLTKMTTARDAAGAYESKALAQADIIDQISPKVGRTFSPMLNDWLLAGKANVAGDTDTALLYNAIQTFSTEYAKIMEGSTGSVAASSESARNASERLIKASMSPQTLKSVAQLMRREMALTMQGYDATISHITERMGGSAPAPSPAAAPAGGIAEGAEKEVPGHPGVIAVYRGGKWIVK